MPRHFIDIADVKSEDLRDILVRAHAMKKQPVQPLLRHKNLAMIFEKPSTRTRISFEVGMRQLGGHALILNHDDMQLGRGESIQDTAKVMSRYVDMVMLRTTSHSKLLTLAEHGSIPVINGLSDKSHPCQILADIMTFEEHRGDISGKTIAWVGDCNNVTQSWVHAAKKFRFRLHIGCPPELIHRNTLLAENVHHFEKAEVAVKGADLVVTDTWISMGCTDPDARRKSLKNYQVTQDLMAKSKPHALFMHCLPAVRGEEVTDEVLDGLQSVVFDEAENRLHAQKAVLAWCLNA